MHEYLKNTTLNISLRGASIETFYHFFRQSARVQVSNKEIHIRQIIEFRCFYQLIYLSFFSAPNTELHSGTRNADVDTTEWICGENTFLFNKSFSVTSQFPLPKKRNGYRWFWYSSRRRIEMHFWLNATKIKYKRMRKSGMFVYMGWPSYKRFTDKNQPRFSFQGWKKLEIIFLAMDDIAISHSSKIRETLFSDSSDVDLPSKGEELFLYVV